MSLSRRRHGPSSGAVLSSSAGPGPRSKLRGLGLSIGFLLALALMLRLYLSVESGPAPQEVPEAMRTTPGKAKKLTGALVRQVVAQVDLQRLWSKRLQPMLVERYAGTPGNRQVQQLIQQQLKELQAGWSVDLDSFRDQTPQGELPFTNIIAILDPLARRRLVVACHFDSKYFPKDQSGRVFVGATDSAVPCSIMLELVTALDKDLQRLKEQKSELTLQLLFLDGEEAFEEWSATDSLYGSRHLAERMANTEHMDGGTEISAMELFLLLDLLGASHPSITSHFANTAPTFDRLITIEKRLHKMGLLQSHPTEQLYFRRDARFVVGQVDDDHVPFLRRGVPVIHFIAVPFPRVWHTMDDNEENLDPPTVDNLCRIITVFVAEYLRI